MYSHHCHAFLQLNQSIVKFFYEKANLTAFLRRIVAVKWNAIITHSHCAQVFCKNAVKLTFNWRTTTINSFDGKKFAWQWIYRFSIDTVPPQCGNYGNSLSRIFGKNFVKVAVLLNRLLKSWFHEIFFRWKRISHFSWIFSTDNE